MACTTDEGLPECAGRSRGKCAKPPWPAGGGWAPFHAIVKLTQELRSLSRKVKEAAGVTLGEATVAGWRRWRLGQHGANHVSVGQEQLRPLCRELKGRQVYTLGKATVAGWRRPLVHAGRLDFPGLTFNSQM